MRVSVLGELDMVEDLEVEGFRVNASTQTASKWKRLGVPW